PAGIVAEIFPITVDCQIAQPNFPAAGSRFHDVEEPEAVESRPVGFVTLGQMTDSFGVVNGGGGDAMAVVAARIVMKGPAVHGAFCGEALQSRLPRLGVAEGGKANRFVAACPPALGGVLEPNIPAP